MQNQTGGMFPQNNGISSSAVNSMQTSGYKDVYYQLEQALGADVQNIQSLLQKGAISKEQGRYLMADLAGKARIINQCRNINPQAQSLNLPQQPVMQQQAEPANVQAPVQTPMEMFNQEHPGFFDGEGRADVLNYIRGFDMDKDEILQISKLVEGIENSAINKYLKKSGYEKSLNDENAAAKSRLTSYAQNAASDSNNNRVFTREDIGNMSGEEFTRNEKLIMEQVKQGLIK